MALRPPTATIGAAAEHLELITPLAVREIDLDRDEGQLLLPPSRNGMPYRGLLAVVRRAERPLGWITLPVARDGTVTLDGVVAAAATHGAVDDELPPASSPTGDTSLLSVVVTTCAHDRAVVRCVETIAANAGDDVELIVVENRPAHSRVERVLDERFGDDPRVRFVAEPVPGLSRARNAGLRAARGGLVAFTDDDVVPDPRWTTQIRALFDACPSAACVTGLILPLELETSLQLLAERFGSFGKGFGRRVYSMREPPADQPLFPFAAGYFGSGANMAFRTAFARELAGFDPVLGTGTPARGGEDLDMCIRVLRAGGTLIYEPRAIVWHQHPDTRARLRRQVFDYGVGLGAMLSKQIVHGPDRRAIMSLAPRAARYFTDPASRKNASRGTGFPVTMSWLERLGLAYGPLAYFASRIDGRRVAATAGDESPDIEAPPQVPAEAHDEPESSEPGQSRESGSATVFDCVLLALILLATAVCLLDVRGSVRAVVLLAAACLVPGGALRRWAPADELPARLGFALGLSFAIEGAGALLMVWTGWWHPVAFTAGLAVVAAGVLAVDLGRIARGGRAA